MTARRSRLATVVVAAMCISAVQAVAGAPAQAAVKRWSATMISEGDWVGQGQHRLFFEGNAEVTAVLGNGTVSLNVSGGSFGDSFAMNFAAPPGQALTPRLYLNAQRTPFREAGRPGIDVYGDGRGCNTIAGRFDVLDIAKTPEGKLGRLWLNYVQFCEGGGPPLSGEIRYNMPGPAARALGARVWFDEAHKGTNGGVVPVWFATPVQSAVMQSASLSGHDPGDFSIRADSCSGLNLGPGGVCVVYVRFNPGTGGPKTALLTLSTSLGPRVVHLEGEGRAVITRLDMRSDSGDYIGQGLDWHYSAGAGDQISVSGSVTGVHFSITGANGDWWYGNFVPADGDILAPGRYAPATRYPFNGAGPGLSVYGEGRGCNNLEGAFTIVSSQFSPYTGGMEAMELRFTQHCEGFAPALRGTLKYNIPLDDDIVPGPVSSVTATPEAGGDSISLSWANPADADLSSVIVRYSAGPKAPPLALSQQFGFHGAGSSAVVSGLRPDKTYRFSLFTVDADGNVGPPVVVVATTATTAAAASGV
jgi:Fibronectin type III domain